MVNVSGLLQGAIDLHVHAGPSVMPREVDSAEMMQEAARAGYQAFVVKDHYFPTMMSAYLVQHYMGNSKVKVYGGVALNNSVGGLNIKAVDSACALGAKFVWMPTVSAENHIKSHQQGLKFPGAHGIKLDEEPIVYINSRGTVNKKVTEILQYMADTDMILGTGHGSRNEVDALVTAAAKNGVKKILVNHPQYMIGASLPDIKKWAALGAYIELNATTYVPESKFAAVAMEEAVKVIKEVDINRLVIDSDYGQKNNGSPVQGMRRFIDLLINQHSIAEANIVKMVKTNPEKLLGLNH